MPAFPGETPSDTIAAIIEREPDWSGSPTQTPPTIRRLLRRCLEKDPKHRLRDIGDARLEIEEALEEPGGVGALAQARNREAGCPPRPARVVGRGRGGYAGHCRRRGVEAATTGILLARSAGRRDGHAVDGFRWSRTPRRHFPRRKVRDFSRRPRWGVECLGQPRRDWRQLQSHQRQRTGIAESRHPYLGFNPDGTRVILWRRVPDSAGGGQVNAGWAVPTLGGPLRPYLADISDISELDWSPDGRLIVYHPPADGDPLFVTAADGKVEPRKIHEARKGFHNHFPVWSHDGAFIYFVHGLPLEKSDVWRIRPSGEQLERLTFHDGRVTFPTLLNDRTLLYLAADDEGYGPWVHAIDLARRRPHRIFTGPDPITSLAASADGRRLVATVSRSTARLWRVPLADRVMTEADATLLSLPTAAALTPRMMPGYLVYRGRKSGRDGIWKLAAGEGATELWNGVNGRVVAGPAVASDGRLAFLVQRRGRTELYVMNADGTGTRRLAEELDVRGAPAWSPDGQWLAVAAANADGEPQLVKIPVAGGKPVALVKEYSTDPIWAPSGRFLIYSGADVGTMFPVKAVNVDGTPFALPSLTLTRGARRLAFLGEEALIILKGNVSHKNFWYLDLKSGRERQLTNLGRGFTIGDFDISPDGREVVFDRIREESDIVLFDLPAR